MTKKLIEQYTSLLEEQKEIEQRIIASEEALQKIIDEGTTKDTVSGGEGGIQHFVIEGYPTAWWDNQRLLLAKRRAQLIDIQNKIGEKVLEVQDYINSIDDSYIRRIITMRVIDRKTWAKIATDIGGNNTPDGIRMTYNRFLESK